MNNVNDPAVALIESYRATQQEVEELRESLASVRAMMDYEDRGWELLAGASAGDHVEGLDLDEVHDIAERLAPKVAAASLEKRAVDLHSGFVWGRGCYIEGTEKPKGPGAPSKLRSFFIDRTNQDSVFGDSAREELQKERFISGNVIAAVNTRTRKVHRIPFSQISAVKVDPDYPENIIAYKRRWDTHDGTKNSVKEEWYYTARFEGNRQKSFTSGGKTIKVNLDVTVVDLRVNRQPGHVFGVPDGLAGTLWAEAYGRIIRYGETVQESLAKILFQVTNKTAKGARSTGVKVAGFDQHGGTASLGPGQELSAVNTAGRGYDFASARPVAAMAASAWNVSNMDLLNDSSAAGSSYGSANALVGGNRNAMLTMQKQWAEFYKDIFQVAINERPSIVFEPFEEPDKYREAQATVLMANALSDEEYRTAALDILNIVGDPSDMPPLLKLRSQPATAGVQQAAPDQGVPNGTSGGGQGANDLRDDTISKEALRREIAIETQLEEMREMMERLEALHAKE